VSRVCTCVSPLSLSLCHPCHPGPHVILWRRHLSTHFFVSQGFLWGIAPT
jgi:hypothetical protein